LGTAQRAGKQKDKSGALEKNKGRFSGKGGKEQTKTSKNCPTETGTPKKRLVNSTDKQKNPGQKKKKKKKKGRMLAW